MQPINPSDVWAASAYWCQGLAPIFLIIAGIAFGINIFFRFKSLFERLDEEDRRKRSFEFYEKPKRSADDLEAEKPKRLIGDDGELFHPIDEFFYTEDSNDGQA